MVDKFGFAYFESGIKLLIGITRIIRVCRKYGNANERIAD